MRRANRALVFAIALAAGGCSVASDFGRFVFGDADAGSAPSDAGAPDSGAPPPPPPPGFELSAGSARIEGERYRMEVQIGHPIGAEAASGGPWALERAAAVDPRR